MCRYVLRSITGCNLLGIYQYWKDYTIILISKNVWDIMEIYNESELHRKTQHCFSPLMKVRNIFDITTIYTSRYLYQIFYNNNKKSYNCFGLVTLLNSELNVFLTLFCILFVLSWFTTMNVNVIVRLSSTNRGIMRLMS